MPSGTGTVAFAKASRAVFAFWIAEDTRCFASAWRRRYAAGVRDLFNVSHRRTTSIHDFAIQHLRSYSRGIARAWWAKMARPHGTLTTSLTACGAGMVVTAPKTEGMTGLLRSGLAHSLDRFCLRYPPMRADIVPPAAETRQFRRDLGGLLASHRGRSRQQPPIRRSVDGAAISRRAEILVSRHQRHCGQRPLLKPPIRVCWPRSCAITGACWSSRKALSSTDSERTCPP